MVNAIVCKNYLQTIAFLFSFLQQLQQKIKPVRLRNLRLTL